MDSSISISVGTLVKTSEDFLIALSGKARFDKVIQAIIEYGLIVRSMVCQKKELVLLSPADLGFNEDAQRVDFFQRARDRGYKLCDLEIVFQYILQRYNEIQNGELFLFAMDPIRSMEDKKLHIIGYCRHNDGDLSITRNYASDDQVFCANRPWFFCK